MGLVRGFCEIILSPGYIIFEYQWGVIDCSWEILISSDQRKIEINLEGM
jgi:hypothetical protein